MTAEEESFEARSRKLLAESLTHVDGRVRSRLTLARHEAVAAAAQRPRFAGLSAYAYVPAAGLAAALAVAVFLWVARPGAIGSATEPLTAFDNVSLLTDSDGLDMVEDADASFYEWAAGQT
jgi:hypothetical protein